MKSSIPIEDDYTDVLGKAMRGMGLNPDELAARTGLSPDRIQDMFGGQWDESSISLLAEALGLNADCMIQLADRPQQAEVVLPDGIRLHNSPFPIAGYAAMTVNSYSILPPQDESEGCLIDAGSSFDSVLCMPGGTQTRKWKLFLTHTHPDHVVQFDMLSKRLSASYTSAREPYRDARAVAEGDQFSIGPWKLCVIETPGHSPGGLSYLLEGTSASVLFAGDAIFSYSIGKVHQDYTGTLDTIRKKILGLPDDTILCPGHGPMTTVAFEKANNPFFA